MKAYTTSAPGQALQLSDRDIPTPQSGEILVQVQAIGLNPVDYKLLRNGHASWQYPHIPGVDAAGVVHSVGEGVDIAPGSLVTFHSNLTRQGTFAEYAITTAHTVTVLPNDTDVVVAAALPCAGLTAYQGMYRKLKLVAGQTILIQGGAGGVGSFSVQLAKHLGATVYATASTHNHEFVRGLGADAVFDYHNQQHLHDEVRKHTSGRGVDAVLDLVGRDSSTNALPLLALNGALATAVAAPDFEAFRKQGNALSFHGIALGAAHLSGDVQAQRDLAVMGQALWDLVSSGVVKPHINTVYTFDELPQALAELSQGHTRGKLVVAL
jgi:NADPH:quinone reductase